jgi:hypothetical protein
MNRVVLGAFAALLLVAAGVFWWQGRAATQLGVLPPLPAAGTVAPADLIPGEDGKGMVGPALPEASEVTREQRRFDRLDRDRDSRITRNEMLVPRVATFRKLDSDGNNLLSFEEWAGKTAARFRNADANRNGSLDRMEFATTKPRRNMQPGCRCAPPVRQASRRSGAAPRATDADESGGELDADEAEPADEI